MLLRTYGTARGAPCSSGSRPGVPKRCGNATVQPNASTRRANSTTFGVMPGISAITITAGPLPARNTSRVLPSKVKVVLSNPSSTSSPMERATYFGATRTICAVGQPSLTPTSYVVLGLVGAFGPCTSYDMKRFVSVSIGYFWPFPHSQLYAEPARLAQLGSAAGTAGDHRPQAPELLAHGLRTRGAARLAGRAERRTDRDPRPVRPQAVLRGPSRRRRRRRPGEPRRRGAPAPARRVRGDRHRPRHRGPPTQDARDGPRVRAHGHRLLGERRRRADRSIVWRRTCVYVSK